MVNVNLENLRRQFPEEIVRYFDALIAEKFSVIDSQIAALQQTAAGLAQQINSAAQQAADQAETRFVQQALNDLMKALTPRISAQIAPAIEAELKK